MSFHSNAIVMLLLALGISMDALDEKSNDYKDEVLEWRAKHEAKLLAPDGWLALTGHYWLHEGINRIGIDPQNEVVLPSDIRAETTAKVTVAQGNVTFECGKDAGYQVDGKPETKVNLTIDPLEAETNAKEKITLDDRLSLQLVRRVNRFAIRVRDKQSKTIANFQGKKWFPVQPEYSLQAKFTPYDPPVSIPIVNIKGDSVETKIVGSLQFEWKGETYKLDAMADSPTELFIVFKDRTSGGSTYAPGRFLDAALPEDGNVRLDFNKAYNPPCAFSPHTLCPLPPKQNHLPFPVEAGERYGKE